MKKKLLSLILISVFGLALIFPETAEARGLVPCGGHGEDACTLCHLIVGIHNIIDWGFRILVFVAIVAIVIAGIMYIVSAGDESMMKKAKDFIKQTLIGFVIVLGAWLIVNYTMILIGTRSDLGVGINDWNDFTCSTETYRNP